MTEVWNDAVTVMRELSLDNINIVTDKPPILANDEDDTFNDDDYDGNHLSSNGVDPADFNYISEMLNMVKNHDDDSMTSSDDQKMDTNKETEKNTLSMTNIGEKPSTSLISENEKVPISENEKAPISENEKAPICVNGKPPSKQSVDEPLPKVDLNNISTTEAVILKEKFKTVINDNSEMTIRKKKRRNVAISNILKLNVIISQSKLPVQNEPMIENVLKLMTPDDFIKKVEKPISEPAPSSEIDKPLENIKAEVVEKPKIDKNHEEPTPDELRESICKVESWLNNESSLDSSLSGEIEINNNSKITARKVLSPINIVTKTSENNSNSPCETPVRQVKKFVPKNKGLYKQYLDKSKAKVERNEDIWDKAQRLMREKEKLMKSQNGSSPSEH